jgi:hypothetical protein
MTIGDILRSEASLRSGEDFCELLRSQWVAWHGKLLCATEVSPGDVARVCGAVQAWWSLQLCDPEVRRRAVEVVLRRAVERAQKAAEAPAARWAEPSAVAAAAATARWAASAAESLASSSPAVRDRVAARAVGASYAAAETASLAAATRPLEPSATALYREFCWQVLDFISEFPPMLEVGSGNEFWVAAADNQGSIRADLRGERDHDS